MDDETLARGREIQAKLWPQMATGGTPRPSTKLAPDFLPWVAASAFGDLWSRPGLAIRDRSLITCAMLAALGKGAELRGHLMGARNLGISQEELVEVLMQVAIYAGVPAANEALTIAADVFGITVD